MEKVLVTGIPFDCELNDIQEDDYVTEENCCLHLMQQLAMAVSCNRPVLICGPVGSGKTSIVEALAKKTGRFHSKFSKVQLGDELDSRILLGGYQVSDMPGEFVWRPGILTQAVMKGNWILLEDIDSASSDVVTLLDNLAKMKCLSVPGLSDNIPIHPSFRIFITQRCIQSDNTNDPSTFFKDWFSLFCPGFTQSELSIILIRRWPKLSMIAEKMSSLLTLDIWGEVTGNIRRPASRDLFKLAARADRYYAPGCPETALRLFHDAVDLMCGSLPNDLKVKVAEKIGFVFGIVKHKAYFISNDYKPNVIILENKLSIGRVVLEQVEPTSASIFRNRKTVYSFTRPSCCLMEQVACCLDHNEPVLLVGETGCGKTCSLQYLAAALNKNLIVINMSQQSEAADFLGGYKPVTFKWLIKPVCDDFEMLFRDLFDVEKNLECLGNLATLRKSERWQVLVQFMSHVQKRALAHIQSKLLNDIPPAKRQKLDEPTTTEKSKEKWLLRLQNWTNIGLKLKKTEAQLKASAKSLLFSYIEGSLIEAIKQGDWILLDEINLASSETLDCLHGILEGSMGSLAVLDPSMPSNVVINKNFRLFAAMNPATDVGKVQLPRGLRNRFTELFIDELENSGDILTIVATYLQELNPSNEKLMKITEFYLKVKADSKTSLLDGNGKKPHYSLRSLCRALMIAAKNPCGSFPRSLYEALCLSFLTQLDEKSYQVVHSLIVATAVDGNDVKSVLRQSIPRPVDDEQNCFCIEGYWVSSGSLVPETPSKYILTNTVRRHLKDLLRVVSLGKGIPVLLEGDTSVGKTSLISYLAKCTGNVCARLNNHEHTDIQEYIGMYVADDKGKLVFKEGILCEAMRKGYWLILDELNLAPTEVLEALNRVLDDNRELYVSETQTVIRAHSKFQLFATQNPPGQYGGRKELSRAFRNRFVELQVRQIPSDELTEILERRCQVPTSYCKKMIGVMNELQLRRRGSSIFVGKSGFITLRDLFRWGERYQLAKNSNSFYDWDHHLADEGYILLSGRVRVLEERRVIRDVLQKYFKRIIEPKNFFSLHEHTSDVTKGILKKVLSYSSTHENFKHIVWTYSMRRLAVLMCKAMQFSEPVLLVGETGCGKTTVVQILATMHHRDLFSVNCHLHSESADFLGGLRPVRDHSRTDGKLFEWVDGPLIRAMQSGSWFLADEISLADDSVLERLNSLLEPERTIMLVEKGGNVHADHVIQAQPTFSFIGTMNPGGDYGKKELSPALRNRLTEIWATGDSDDFFSDFRLIAQHNLNQFAAIDRETVADAMLQFMKWFQNVAIRHKTALSTRDLLTWVQFINTTVENKSLTNLTVVEGLYHGCCLTFLDAIESLELKSLGINKICEILSAIPGPALVNQPKASLTYMDNHIGIHPFYTSLGPEKLQDRVFVFDAPTTRENAWKLLRGLQTGKAILLEGSPGVGKTSLVEAFAKASGHNLVRINLSEQTDVSDLFGADLPAEGECGGRFEWRDGPFLRAMQARSWILLDELNLASQSVLEGLNAVLDHRGELFVPELNRTFRIPSGTRLFACQNPLNQGGNRRGLPKSFLNRFTRVNVDILTPETCQIVLEKIYNIQSSTIRKMILFSKKLHENISLGKLGVLGGPWELNLRDLSRWCSAIQKHPEATETSIFHYMQLLYQHRFRTESDRQLVLDIYFSIFEPNNRPILESPVIFLTSTSVHIAEVCLRRKDDEFHGSLQEIVLLAIGGEYERKIAELCDKFEGFDVRPLQHQSPLLVKLARCVQNNWLPILVGESGTGKTSVIRLLAALTGNNLRVMSVNSSMDTTEILGGFEQESPHRHVEAVLSQLRILLLTAVKHYLLVGEQSKAHSILSAYTDPASSYLKPDFFFVFHTDDSHQDVLVSNRIQYLRDLLNLEGLVYDEISQRKHNAISRMLDLVHQQFLNRNSSSIANSGRFEWVDSILVKSLQDGSWLVLEDVNLCSNAVLDRLNAVLEPGGSLTIGERGALSDGRVVDIKPHNNFRLFFTMNPRNGGISRAMRNRGVEIYISPLTDRDANDIDLMALMMDSNLCDLEMQSLLLQFHKNMLLRSEINLGHIRAASFWTVSYLKHNFNEETSLKRATSIVYKNEEIPVISQKGKRDFNLELARPSLTDMLVHPQYTRMKQACTWIASLAHSHSNLSSNGKINILEPLLPYFLLISYLQTAPCIVKDQSRFLRETLSLYPHLQEASDILSKICLEFKGNKELAWDMRWYGNATAPPKVNSILISLIYKLNIILSKPKELPVSSRQNENLSIAQCCRLINTGQMGNILLDAKVVKEFLSIIETFDDAFVKYLILQRGEWSDEQAEWFLSAFKWRIRLSLLGDITLVSRKPKIAVMWDVLSAIKMHLLWFRKNFVNCIPTLNEDKALLKFKSQLDSMEELNISSKLKMANLLRRQLGAPLCTENKINLEVYQNSDLPLLSYFQLVFAIRLHSDIVNGSYSSTALSIWNKIQYEQDSRNRPLEANVNTLFLKTLLLHFTDIGYNFSMEKIDINSASNERILPLHRATITSITLGKIFPFPPSNLLSIQKDLDYCEKLKRLIFPNCLDINSVWIYERERLQAELSNIVSLIKVLVKRFYQNDKFFMEIEDMLSWCEKAQFHGNQWLLLGLVVTLLLSQGIIDPVRKKLVKTEYAMDEISELESELYCHLRSAEVTGINLDHFYIKALKQRLITTYSIVEKHESIKGVTRNPKLFENLCLTLRNFTEQLSQRLLEAAIKNIERFGSYLVLRDSIKESQRSLETQFLKDFPDVVLPLLYAHQMMEHGLNLILINCKQESTFEAFYNMCLFPFKPFALIHLKNELEALTKLPQNCAFNVVVMLETSLAKVTNQRILTGMDVADSMLLVFSEFVERWKKQELEAERLEREKESLYLTKGTTKCIEQDDDKEIEEAVEKLFPTYSDDFNGAPSTNENNLPHNQSELEVRINLATLDYVRMCCCGLLDDIVQSPWIDNRASKLTVNFLKPLRSRYLVLNQIWPQIGHQFLPKLDTILLPGILVLLPTKILEDNNNSFKDFYQDSHRLEASRCLPVLSSLKEKLHQLLNDWPEHPTLLQINAVIERILSFSIESPIMRYLTGLEILLQTCQHWESVAHLGVSIADHLISITNLIIEWRKLELQCWRHCLDKTRTKIKQEACKWWFHLCELLKESTSSGNDENVIFQTLANFMENSPIGEFSERLQIIRTFHALILLKEETLAVNPIRVWNLYRFYQQYEDIVESQLAAKTAAVSKQLKDFVKIAKWHDITYWSVKQSVDKSHRTLVKYIKDYEKILKQKVQLINLDVPSCKNKTDDLIISKHFNLIPPSSYRNTLSGLNFPKPIALLNKTYKFSSFVIRESVYPVLIQSVNEFVGDIINSVDHFNKTLLDDKLPLEKRKSEIKSFIQQKRRALSDLFNVLGNAGLSYRTGVLSESWGPLEISKGPPLSFKTDFCDRPTGEDYFLKSALRLCQLQVKLLKPSKEIGPPTIERLRGYAAHIMNLMQRMHSVLVENETPFLKLKDFYEEIQNSTGDTLNPSDLEVLMKVENIIQTVLYTLKQFEIVFESWPEDDCSAIKELNFLGGDKIPRIMISSKNNLAYEQLKEHLSSIINATQVLRSQFKTSGRNYGLDFTSGTMKITREQKKFNLIFNTQFLMESVRGLKDILSQIAIFKSKFENHLDENHLVACLNFNHELEVLLAIEIENQRCKEPAGNSVEFSFGNEIEKIIRTNLVVVQNFYKKYSKSDKVTVENKENDQLTDNHITVKLVENLTKDLKLLQTNDIFLEILKLHQKISTVPECVFKENLNLIKSILPFLKYYLDLADYFISQCRNAFRTVSKLASVLLGVFNLIAEKGFCTPPDIDEDEQGDGDDGQGGGGLGLADGQGKKDVSDRIESEDQLEDARPADEEKNNDEDDPECEEEEKGIETSEDFGGKAQDLKKGDDEMDDVNDEGEEELDKEMGETEEGADQLDKQLWGSDDDDDDNDNASENENDMKEDRGKGEKMGEENVYGAKEEEDDSDETSDRNNKSKRDIEEMEDVDEGEQIDPYHGHFEPPPEPEDFELPENMDIDDKIENDGEGDEENPFDVDEMKNQIPDNDNEEEKINDNTNDDKLEPEMENNEENPENEEENEKDSESKGENEEQLELGEKEKSDTNNTDNELPDAVNMEDTFKPSKDKPAETPVQGAPDSKDSGSKDQIVANESTSEEVGDREEKSDEQSAESSGIGQAEMEQGNSGHNVAQSRKASTNPNQTESRKKYEKPGKSNIDRSVEDRLTKQARRMQTIEQSVIENEKDETVKNELDVDTVQHIKNAKEHSMQVLDAATEEQLENQPIPNKDDEPGDSPEENVPMDIDDPIELKQENIDQISATANESKHTEESKLDGGVGETVDETNATTEGEIIETMRVERGNESFLHVFPSLADQKEPLKPLLPEEIEILRIQIQQQLAVLKRDVPVSAENAEAWQMINATVDSLARELSEQLRLVLEPSRATRFKGDYRSGRRINMRKVISYIASEFRKDRIWLRRTKPWKREHQIVLAIDDSSSMADNKSKELAFESLALVSKSLNLLEAGDLSVVSFGESCRVLHPLGEPFTDETGARLLSELRFEQNKTRVAAAIDLTVEIFTKSKLRDAAQLLLIVSDGRGVFSEGLDNVRMAVRRAHVLNILIVFIIIDDPKSKDSIMDIRMPEFKEGKFLGIKPYMQNFPFNYYLMLRDINALPGTLCDALRQWFSITTPTV